jgi:hypothetical protein
MKFSTIEQALHFLILSKIAEKQELESYAKIKIQNNRSYFCFPPNCNAAVIP